MDKNVTQRQEDKFHLFTCLDYILFNLIFLVMEREWEL